MILIKRKFHFISAMQAEPFPALPSYDVLLPVKKFVASSRWRPFWKFWIIKHSFNLTSDMKSTFQIMPKESFFHDDDVIDDVKG